MAADVAVWDAEKELKEKKEKVDRLKRMMKGKLGRGSTTQH